MTEFEYKVCTLFVFHSIKLNRISDLCMLGSYTRWFDILIVQRIPKSLPKILGKKLEEYVLKPYSIL